MSSVANVSQVFQTAVAEGDLSSGSNKALQVLDLGAQIQAALGTPALSMASSEVVLVSMLIDDSGSIRFVSGNTEAVRDGHNLVIDSLGESKQKDNILLHTRYLNGQLFPYQPLSQAVKLDAHNYNPHGGTPLYDQSVAILGTVIAKHREFFDIGVPARTITLIVTDGHDEHSVKSRAIDVSTIVNDMYKSESHIVAFMGVDDGRTDFRVIAKGMGIRDEWILTPGNNSSEIRKAFQVFSQSAIRASQNAVAFSKQAAGGFLSP